MIRRFTLERSEDVSGTSGTGRVAEGVVFSDGVAVLRWATVLASTAVYDSLDDLIAIHGHNGATQVVWMDEEPFARNDMRLLAYEASHYKGAS